MKNESFQEDFALFKAGVETMVPVGSLVKLTKFGARKANSLLRKDENDVLCTAQLDNQEPFTILELQFPQQQIEESENDYLFYDYRVYMRVIQFDVVGWMHCRWSATRYDEALKLLAKSMAVEV